VYAATIDVDVARHSGGVYLVRLEDTDQARVAEGAAAQFAEAFAYFSIGPDEDDRSGRYGPYSQSLRAQTYLTYVRELLRQDTAYRVSRPRRTLRRSPPGSGPRAPCLAITASGRCGVTPIRLGDERLEAGDPYSSGSVPPLPPGQGELHRRDPRRAYPGRQPQRRGHPEEQ